MAETLQYVEDLKVKLSSLREAQEKGTLKGRADETESLRTLLNNVWTKQQKGLVSAPTFRFELALAISEQELNVDDRLFPLYSAIAASARNPTGESGLYTVLKTWFGGTDADQITVDGTNVTFINAYWNFRPDDKPESKNRLKLDTASREALFLTFQRWARIATLIYTNEAVGFNTGGGIEVRTAGELLSVPERDPPGWTQPQQDLWSNTIRMALETNFDRYFDPLCQVILDSRTSGPLTVANFFTVAHQYDPQAVAEIEPEAPETKQQENDRLAQQEGRRLAIESQMTALQAKAERLVNETSPPNDGTSTSSSSSQSTSFLGDNVDSSDEEEEKKSNGGESEFASYRPPPPSLASTYTSLYGTDADDDDDGQSSVVNSSSSGSGASSMSSLSLFSRTSAAVSGAVLSGAPLVKSAVSSAWNNFPSAASVRTAFAPNRPLTAPVPRRNGDTTPIVPPPVLPPSTLLREPIPIERPPQAQRQPQQQPRRKQAHPLVILALVEAFA